MRGGRQAYLYSSMVASSVWPANLRPVFGLRPACADSWLGLRGSAGWFGDGTPAENEPAGQQRERCQD